MTARQRGEAVIMSKREEVSRRTLPCAMWTCPKCGELIEGQFDSCWKCAGEAQKKLTAAAAPKLKWFHYVFAVFISCAIPWFAVCVHDSSASWRAALLSHGFSFYDIHVWLWMTVPAAINFLIFLPFLKSPRQRLVVLFCLWLGWTCLLILGNRLWTTK
jgi:hypothetical protein